MNLLTHFKQIILPIFITIVFGCFGLLPQAQAKVGCFPAFTTSIGCDALTFLNGGVGNTGYGWFALFMNVTGNYNTALGAGALDLNTADFNTATGAAALLLNTTGTQNTATGTDAIALNDSGSADTASGYFALYNNTTGSDNTAIGSQALLNNTTGSDNTAIGQNAASSVVTAANVICIGSNVAGADVSNTTWIGNVFDVTTQSGTTAPVIVSDTGQLGTVVSSERFKKDITTMDKASEAILAFRPVTFHYKTDTKDTPQFGLIAEEVAKVNPALVLPDKEGKPFTVRYDAVNAMLLNEFLKAHRRMEEQDKRIEELTVQLKEQAAQIQQVSAQLEANKPEQQMVAESESR
jgi:hypothetical protein